VMGAYTILFPEVLVRVVWINFRDEAQNGVTRRRFRWTDTIEAGWFLRCWLVLQVLYGLENQIGVAWWAHIGGFVAGMAIAWLLCLFHPAAAVALKPALPEPTSSTGTKCGQTAGAAWDQRWLHRNLGAAIGPVGSSQDKLVPVDTERAMIAKIKELWLSGESLRHIQTAIEREYRRRLSLEALSRITQECGY
jgi:hypothetical protein